MIAQVIALVLALCLIDPLPAGDTPDGGGRDVRLLAYTHRGESWDFIDVSQMNEQEIAEACCRLSDYGLKIGAIYVVRPDGTTYTMRGTVRQGWELNWNHRVTWQFDRNLE